jgi:hypothetical protein
VRYTLLLFLLTLVPGMTSAQSSQFGVRGLGYPGRGLAVRASGSSGGFGLFDSESSLNPAALGAVPTLTSVFTVAQSFRHPENPAGTASVRDTRFPHILVAGPIRQSGAVFGVSYSNYTSRDYSLTTADTLDIRGVPVGVTDSFSSRGGLNDLRVAGAYRVHDRWMFGGGFHIITGSTRLVTQREFSDSTYLSSRQRSELSYTGVGLSVGVIRQFGPGLAISALARTDGHANVDLDSGRVATVDLPYTFGLGVRVQPAAKLDVGLQGIMRTWSGANSDLLEQGGTGANNTVEVSVGAQYTSDPKRPFRRPIRLGARYATLPFPLVPGEQGHEMSISFGTGMRFAQQRAGVDLSLEHYWRSEGVYSERAFILSFGVSVRP